MSGNLVQACWEGDLATVRELIAVYPCKVNQPTVNSKTTPLHWAVKNDTRNAVEVTRLLLDAGADVNYVSDVDERGLSPLLAALVEDGCMDLAVVRLLVDRGAVVNCHTKNDGFTPLQYACHAGDNEIVTFLLDSGADVRAVDFSANTALHYACGSRRADEALVAMLLARGAAVDQVGYVKSQLSCGQFRPLHYACQGPKSHLTVEQAKQFPDRSGMVRLLLRHGAQVQRPTDHGFTPLYAAVFTESPVKHSAKVIKILLDHGADIDLKVTRTSTAKVITPLWRANAFGTPETKALLRRYLAMRVRRCVLGPASEHSRRQRLRDLAPDIASFLV
jgi:ankyrin repeat protein